MAQDDEAQQTYPVPASPSEGHEANTDTGNHESATTASASPPNGKSGSHKSDKGVISETWSLYWRLLSDPKKPEFQDGYVTRDNNVLFRLLVFVLLVASIAPGVRTFVGKGISIKNLSSATLESLSSVVLFNISLLIPLLVVTLVATLYSVSIAYLCRVYVDVEPAMRVFALRGFPFIPLWAIFYVWDPHTYHLAIIWYLTMWALFFATFRGIFIGLRKILPHPLPKTESNPNCIHQLQVAPESYIGAIDKIECKGCASWRIVLSLIIPLAIIGWVILWSAGNYLQPSSLNTPNSSASHQTK